MMLASSYRCNVYSMALALLTRELLEASTSGDHNVYVLEKELRKMN